MQIGYPPQPAKNIKKLCRIRELDMGVSKNNGTPKSSILIGVSTINHPFGDTPIFGNIHILTGTPRITQFQWSLALRMHFKLITPLGTIRQIKSESPRSCGSRVLLRCCQSFFVRFFPTQHRFVLFQKMHEQLEFVTRLLFFFVCVCVFSQVASNWG